MIHFPVLKEEVELLDDWTFNLYDEHRNYSLFKKMKFPERTTDRYCWCEYLERPEDNRMPFTPVTLPIGTVLSIDRMFVRQGLESFNSITFRLKSCPRNKKLEKARFWVKISDANRINGVFIPNVK